MAKIESLTPEQEQLMYLRRREAFEVGTRTGDVGREKAEKIINGFYKRIGKEQPYFWYVDSPLMGSIIIGIVRTLKKENLGANLGDNLWANLRANLRDNLWANLGDNLWDNLWDNLGANLFNDTNLWGQIEIYWQIYYMFANEIGVEFAPENKKLLEEWMRLSNVAYWWWPYEGICFMSQRPSEIHMEPTSTRDFRFRLHNENDMAISFRDGYGLYYWHGVVVPKYVITNPEKITKKKILSERNAEVRRAMIERIGYEKFMEMSEPTVIDSRLKKWTKRDGTKCSFTERLLQFAVENDEPIVVMHVKDSSTDREYFLGVPPDTKTVLGGLAWSFDVDKEVYKKSLVAET